MVNDYTDGGKRRPKNPDPLGPPSFLHEGTWGISAPTLHDESFGVMSLLPRMDPESVSTLTPLKPPATAEHVKSLLLLAKMQ